MMPLGGPWSMNNPFMPLSEWVGVMARERARNEVAKAYGLRRDEYDKLEQLAQRIEHGHYRDDRETESHRRWMFARWLIENGKLSEYEIGHSAPKRIRLVPIYDSAYSCVS